MWRTVAAVFLATSVLGVATGCGEAGDKMTKGLLERLDGMDVAALKTKAEAATGEVKAKAMALLAELEPKKAEAIDLLKKVAGGDASVEAKAKEAAKTARRLYDELKKLLGM